MDERSNPHEVSLDRRCISWSKGCYLGQEAVCMQDMRGKVKRRLVVLRLGEGPLPSSGTAVHDAAGTPVGETRSAAMSPIFGGGVALASVMAGCTSPGTRLVVAGVPAEVTEPRR